MSDNKDSERRPPHERDERDERDEREGVALDRRGFLAGAAGALTTAGCAEDLFRHHYTRMTDADKEALFRRLEAQTKRHTQRTVRISDPAPVEGAAFAFCLDLSACKGTRRCVTACVEENNCSRDPEVQYIQVFEMNAGVLEMDEADRHYDTDRVPRSGKVYVPVQCFHCEQPPCVQACPTEATWRESDGIVVVDYGWCIGCRYCMAACPYEARRFNFETPDLPPKDVNPVQAYLSNRIRPAGVVEKCHLCLHRTRAGQYPACLEACPTGARKFGNLADPDSDVSHILRTKSVFVLKKELGTVPRFFYYYG